MTGKYNYLIVGSGIIGLTMAHAIRKYRPTASILIIDKEKEEAFHASSRNSGVLHAGFYYSADSLKAKFTVEGNRAMKAYCKDKNIPVNECGKLVVAQNQKELDLLHELERRGKRNGANVKLIDISLAERIDPNVKTFEQALFSPDTASVNPKQVCQALKHDLVDLGIRFLFDTRYLARKQKVIETNKGSFEVDHLINCGGLYADTIAQDFGFGQNYTMIPFKGTYLKYTKNTTDIKTNIYPVPNLKNPFLGVHFTKTVTGEIKIGPTAIPAFWRENYSHFSRFDFFEFIDIISQEARLFFSNAFGFRNLAFEEIKKYNKRHFIRLAQRLVKSIDPKGFTGYTAPGIRAQLLDTRRRELVQDFVIEGDAKSTHVLNAVSPAFTCAFPFSDSVVRNYVLRDRV